jgi:receptor protein-tyrosine kinase
VALEYDHTVLLVDGDLAHPSVPRLLGLPSSPGLLDLLTNPSLGINQAIIGTDVEGLSILPAGTSQRRVTELVASEQMGRLVDALANEDRDRIVIFDSSPLLATTEARVLASHMGQIVMVVAAEATSQNTLNMALATIENCEVVLMMLNKASLTEVGTYGYYPGNDRG